MKRLVGLILSLGVAISTAGCIAAIGNRGELGCGGRQAVVVDGEILIVDLEDGSARKAGTPAVAHADIIVDVEISDED